MKTIYKYKLEKNSQQKIEIPKDAKILCLQMQYGEPCIWAEVETNNPLETRSFFRILTGHPIPDNPSKYIGTYQSGGGEFVFHVFELIKSPKQQ